MLRGRSRRAQLARRRAGLAAPSPLSRPGREPAGPTLPRARKGGGSGGGFPRSLPQKGPRRAAERRPERPEERPSPGPPR